MPPKSPEKSEKASGDSTTQHLNLILSALRNVKGGKVNYAAVAEEMGITSSAATQKRLERFLKTKDMKMSHLTGSFGTASTNNDSPKSATPGSSRKRAAKGETKQSNKKAKVDSGASSSPTPLDKTKGDEEIGNFATTFQAVEQDDTDDTDGENLPVQP